MDERSGARKRQTCPCTDPAAVTRPFRLIHASRLFSQEITRQRVGARPGTTAQIAIFAVTALPSQIVSVAKRLEKGRLAIYGGKRVVADVTGGQGQESTGEDLPRVRHEHESLAVIDTGLPLNDLGANRARPSLSCSFGLSPLRHVPAIMLRFGGLDIEGRYFDRS